MSDTETTEVETTKYRTYSDIVWRQFKSYNAAHVALYGVGILFLIAVFAPVIAFNVPFYLYVPEGAGPKALQGVSFPWFTALFDRNYFGNSVDIFFNFLLFSLPLNLIIWFIARKKFDKYSRRKYKQIRSAFISYSFLIQVGLFIAVWFIEFRQPYVDYVALAEKNGVSAWFPYFEFAYQDTDIMATGLAPSWEHWLGTDAEGHDILTRLIYGTRISLTVGVVAMGLSAIIGTILGSLGGYFGGKTDMVVLRLIEVMLCFPTLFIILTLRGFIEEPSIFHVMGIIGIVAWTRVARLVRGEFLKLKNEDFVQAAQALGLPEHRVIFRHILPNALGPILVATTFGIASAILIEATLSFLGVGPTGAPSWGQILKSASDHNQRLITLASGFAIFVTVSLLNLVGEGVRDAIDPKLRD